jgi:hypothetical protein
MTSFDSDSLLLLFMGAVFIISIGFAIFQRSKRDELLANQAVKRGAEFVKGSLTRHSILHLPYKGNVVVIYSRPGSRNSSPRTIASMRPNGMTLPTIEVLRNDVTQKIMGAFGKERILLNDEEFDRRCIVRSDDPFLPQRILLGDLQQRFLDRTLRSLELRVSAQNVEVKMLAIPRDEESFDYFIDTVFAILQKIL